VNPKTQIILVPIKYTIPLNMFFSVTSIGTNNNVDKNVNRNELLKFLCDTSDDEYNICDTSDDEYNTSLQIYNFLHEQNLDYCVAKELIDENDIIKILVCEFIVEERKRHYDDPPPRIQNFFIN
jgi:hypothetical protein